jgi:hypothetical protein
MMQMKAPEISPSFSIEDIHNIREYDAERYWTMPKEKYWAEVRASSLQMQAKLKEIRKHRLALESTNMSQAM